MSRAVIVALAAVAVSGSAAACAASDDRAAPAPGGDRAPASPWAARHEIRSRVQTRLASPQSHGCVAFGRRSTVVWLNDGGSTPAGRLAQSTGC